MIWASNTEEMVEICSLLVDYKASFNVVKVDGKWRIECS